MVMIERNRWVDPRILSLQDPNRDDKREAASQDRLVRLLKHQRDLLGQRAAAARLHSRLLIAFGIPSA